MPTKPPGVCARCGTTYTGPHCACRADARRESDHARGTAAERGYDHRWARTRADYLRHHPRCVLCGRPATVADHYPETRRSLVDRGVPNPDVWHRLRPLCKPCHYRHTALTSPGGWNRNR
jgi:5-methylcytosine-specific restriction protein A